MATVRHTTCRHCGQDIEGFAPWRKGEWRDRGNNATCPQPLAGYPGKSGMIHAPLSYAQQANRSKRT